ncbi:MAG: TIGR03546 family protein [bacterium]|nr:TIGR03546 family protein [bacterium]
MFPGIGPVSNLIKILHSDASPAQVAGGVALGLIIGLTPLLNIHNLLVLFIILLIRINLGSAMLSFMLFSLIAYLLDPLYHQLGLMILKSPELQTLWTDLYNAPGMRLTRFNNSIVMGSLALSLILIIPVWLAAFAFVRSYRGSLKEKIDNLRIVKLVKASSIYKWYERIRFWTV